MRINKILFNQKFHFVHWNSKKYKTASEALNSSNHDGLLVLGTLVQVCSNVFLNSNLTIYIKLDSILAKKVSKDKNEEIEKLISCFDEIELADKSAKLKNLNFAKLFPGKFETNLTGSFKKIWTL